MNVTREDFDSGWSDIFVGLTPGEIDQMIRLLQDLKENPTTHFHIGSEFKDNSRVSDIEFHVKREQDPDNMMFFANPIEPND
jgi:hypothetical protein